MKLVSFRVQNYRSIEDSGWVPIDNIACIVGKNEAGKTSLLKALWKFNPFRKETYSLDREWPRGRRKDRDKSKPVCSCKFQFSAAEIKKLEALHESLKGITEVTIVKSYGGGSVYTFGPSLPPDCLPRNEASELLNAKLALSTTTSPAFKTSYEASRLALITTVVKSVSDEVARNLLADFKTKIAQFASPDPEGQALDNVAISTLQGKLDELATEFQQTTPARLAVNFVHPKLPTFIYMDDYRVFSGRAQLDQVKARKDQNQLTDEDETVLMIMEESGLDLDEEVIKGQVEDREQRMLDMNDASQTLTNEIASRWSQKKYEVQFQVDGQHFITFVKDSGKPVLVPLEERSKGFQWFFSFDMTFMCETQGSFSNAVILLDEPGLHLHASAQRDLMKRMYAYAEHNQLIYTTHLPFMVDPQQLNSIHVCEESPTGSIVHQNWQHADAESRFTLQAALGLSWSQSLFVGQFNLVVEGITDFWFLTAISTMLGEAGKTPLDPELVITPAGGASKLAYVATILKGQDLHVCVLLDSDAAGKSAFEQLVHQWLVLDKYAFMLGAVVGTNDPFAIEDLFGDNYFLEFVSKAYDKELGGKPLAFKKSDKRSIVDRVESAMSDKGLVFNKGKIAKLIIRDIANKKLDDFDPATQQRFDKVIEAINSAVTAFRGK